VTAQYGTTHGTTIAALRAHVVPWNWTAAESLYREFAGADLAERLDEMAATAGLPRRLRDLGFPRESLPALAERAATQWTGRFNPGPVSVLFSRSCSCAGESFRDVPCVRATRQIGFIAAYRMEVGYLFLKSSNLAVSWSEGAGAVLPEQRRRSRTRGR